jgi:hypothetical protein
VSTNDDVRYPFWRAHPWLTAGGVAAVIVLVAWLVVSVAQGSNGPVYVTDGSYVFSDNLRSVENQILAENNRVTANGNHYVTIAFSDYMNPEAGNNAVTQDEVRHDLEGAHIAQLAWNHPLGRSPEVPVKLLLVDQGARGASWSPAADALAGKVTSDHLVAVVGLGISIDTTRNLIDRLVPNKVGLVGAALTGDSMTTSLGGSGPVPGMVRAAPTNTNEAEAAVRFLDTAAEIPDHPAIMLVQDQNKTEDYALTLGKAFTAAVTAGTARHATMISPGISIDSSLGDAGMILGASAEKVCTAHADVVYFAGREGDLQGFLTGLATRTCARDRHLTVISGDGVAHLSGKPLWQGADANLTVIFTSIAHPAMWQQNPSATSAAIAAHFGDCETCFRGLFHDEPPTALDDTGAIMSHDSVWLALKAVEYTRNPNPSASAVAQALNQLRVALASGWVCAFDGDHNPVNKAIPIVEVDQTGGLSYKALSSSQGSPPTTCPA